MAVGVPADDRDQMDQGVGGEEPGAGNGSRPVPRPQGPRGERETGGEERHADVLDEMRVERPGFGYAGDMSVPERSGDKHGQAVDEGGYRENCCY
jgi:hypothetical protein